MAIYTINITLTDDKETAMQDIAVKAGKNVQQILEEFFTGYYVDEIFQQGSAMNQINQWISDEIKAKVVELGPAETLAKLNA